MPGPSNDTPDRLTSRDGRSSGARRLAPLDDPLSYPGERATGAFRLRDNELRPLTEPIPAGRLPVLSIGSNACPAQLTAKFHGRPCSGEVFGVLVSVARLQIRPSAHLGRSGYWPFAPAALDGTSSPAVLCFLDANQVAVLDATEPNYLRVPLDPGRHPVNDTPQIVGRLAAAHDTVWVYVSKHGVVDDPRLPAWTDPPPTQRSLLGALIPLLPLPRGVATPESLSAALRTEAGLAGQLTSALQERLMVRASGLVPGQVY